MVTNPDFIPNVSSLTLRRPDNCDGTYSQNCDESRQYTNITDILQYYGATSLLDYMNQYWVSDNGDEEKFWEHEWGKHGRLWALLVGSQPVTLVSELSSSFP